MVMTLSMRKARALVAVFEHPFHVDMVSDIETMYTETLQAIGDRGRLAGDYYIELGRDYCKGIYTCTYALSLRIDKDNIVVMGRIMNMTLSNCELRFDVVDGKLHYAIILIVED